MSAKYYSPTHPHRHPYCWDEVAENFFLRYPNPHSRHVLTEDTLHREVIEGDILYTRRFITKDLPKLPKWVLESRFSKSVFSRVTMPFVPLLEESFVNQKLKVV